MTFSQLLKNKVKAILCAGALPNKTTGGRLGLFQGLQFASSFGCRPLSSGRNIPGPFHLLSQVRLCLCPAGQVPGGARQAQQRRLLFPLHHVLKGARAALGQRFRHHADTSSAVLQRLVSAIRIICTAQESTWLAVFAPAPAQSFRGGLRGRGPEGYREG